MKMICPHCGVKGSADESLLQRKVKCPRCLGIFKVDSEVVEAIPVDDLELEQLEESTITASGESVEGEVGGNLDDIFSTGTAEGQDQELDESEIDRLLTGTMDEQDDAAEQEVAAALADFDEQGPAGEWEEEEEEEEETLTVIEGIQEEKGPGAEEKDTDAEEAEELLPDEEIEAALQADADDEAASVFDQDDGEEVLDFEDELISELEADQQEREGEETELTLEDITDDPEEELDIWAMEPETDDASEELELTADEDEAELEPTVDEGEAELETAVDEGEAELELTVDEGEAELEDSGADPADEGEEAAEEELENSIQKCSACGVYVDQNAKYKLGTNVYCDKCVPRRNKDDGGSSLEAAAGAVVAAAAASAAAAAPGKFTVSTLIKDAWSYSKGAKGAIWGGVIVMYLLLIGLGAGGVYLLPMVIGTEDPLTAILAETGFEIIAGFLSYIFTAGIIVIAVNKIGNESFSWKMVFSGFGRLGSLLLLYILQAVLLVIGFLLLILPGIYLSVGYMLAIPLVMIKGMSPWQALEASRKAIHTRWWTVFFSFIAMALITAVSTIPLGIGLIWTVPMFVVLIGILYYHFFGDEE